MSEQCTARVYDQNPSWGSRPCTRKGVVFEDDKWRCTQHSKAAAESRRAKQHKRWDEERDRTNRQNAEQRERNRRAECFPRLLAALEAAARELAAHVAMSEKEYDVGYPEAQKALVEARAAVAEAKGEGQ